MFTVVVFSIIMIFVYNLVSIYRSASQKHRKEKSRVYLYFGSSYYATPIVVSRCFVDIINMFKCKYVGVSFLGARVVVKVNSKFVVCAFSEKRANACGKKYDLGAGGMVSSTQTCDMSAHEELFEELGIDDVPKYKFTVTPAQGFYCIVAVYIIDITVEQFTKMRSIDGTFIKFDTYSIDDVHKVYNEMRNDSVKLLKSYHYLL